MSSDELARKLARRRTGETIFQNDAVASSADANAVPAGASEVQKSPDESSGGGPTAKAAGLVPMADGQRFAAEAGEELVAKLARRRQTGETVYERPASEQTPQPDADNNSTAGKSQPSRSSGAWAGASFGWKPPQVSTSCCAELAQKLAKRRWGEEIFSGHDDAPEPSSPSPPSSPTAAHPTKVNGSQASAPSGGGKEPARRSAEEEQAAEAEKKQAAELQKLLQAGMKAHQTDNLDAAEPLYLQVLSAKGLTPSTSEPLSSEGIQVCKLVSDTLHMLGALRMQRQVAAGDAADSEDEDGSHHHHSPHRKSNAETVAAVSLLRCAVAALPETETPDRKARPLTSLGTGLLRLGDESSLKEAVVKLREATELDPRRWSAHFNLARALALLQDALDRAGHDDEAQGLPDERVRALEAACKIRPDHEGTLYKLGMALKDRGRPQEAIQVFMKYVELARASAQKENNSTKKWRTATVMHWLAVLRGEDAQAAPAEYVAGLFDSYAEKFDQHLVQGLGYSTPQLLADEIRLALTTSKGGPAPQLHRCVDLGCGTGLMGPLLKELGVEQLDGVDLSKMMLEKAEERGCYNRLVCGDLLHVFSDSAAGESKVDPYDLVVAADVFVYLGDLTPIFTAIAASLTKPHGLVAVSTEAPPRTGGANEGSCTVPAGGFAWATSGRCMHSAAYVRSTGEACGLLLTTRRSVVLRYNGGKPVHGHLHIFRHAVSAGDAQK